MPQKLTMNMVAMGNLKHRKKHYIGLICGILLAMVFICGISFLESCMETSRQESRYRNFGKQTEIVLDAQNVDMEKVVNSGSLIEEPGYIHVTSYLWFTDPEQGTAVGWLDEQAKKLYYLQIQEGRMPEVAGEIALEESALRSLAPNTKLGEEIQVLSGSPDSPENKTYRLVGILGNRKAFLEQRKESLKQVPSAFIAEPMVPPADEALIALLNGHKGDMVEGKKTIYDYCDSQNIIPTFLDGFSRVGVERAASTVSLSSKLSKMLAALSCIAIAGAFYGDLMQRRQQIGMLRAVGATRRQILILYGREALLLALLCIPLGVAAAYFAVKLFAVSLNLIFRPDWILLVKGGAVSFCAVIASALIPLLAAASVPPMQAIRGSALMRQVKRKKIRSSRAFTAPGLLARRRLLFYGAQRWLMVLVLALSTGIFSVYAEQSLFRIGENMVEENYDYDIHPRGYTPYGDTGYINKLGLNPFISEKQRLQCLALPDVAKVDGEAYGYAGLLLQGEIPPYLELWGAFLPEYNSKYATVRLEVGWNGTPEEFWKEAHKERNPNYIAAKEIGGYDQEIVNMPVFGYSMDLLKQLSSNVTEGEIRPEKLRSGEEVILCAPKKIGYIHYQIAPNVVKTGVFDLTEGSHSIAKVTERDRSHLAAQAVSPFSVGDTLKLSVLYDHGEGIIRRTDKEVTIGAIIDCYGLLNGSSGPAVFTTVENLNQLGGEFEYKKIYVTLKEECTQTIDMEMQKTFESLFPGKMIRSTYEVNQYSKERLRNEKISMAALFAVFLAASAGIISNHMTARIREGKRTIGTLRAVGADQSTLVRSYLNEILIICLSGTALGLAGFLIYEWICIRLDYGYGRGFNCIPAIILIGFVFICCCVNLWIQVKKVSKYSIVENIRELG